MNGWVLVPAVALDEADAVSPCAALAAGGLARLYELDGHHGPLGAFVHRAGEGVGGEFDAAEGGFDGKERAIAFRPC